MSSLTPERPDRPPEMYQNGRPADPEFEAFEEIYYRVAAQAWNSAGEWDLDALDVHSPDISVNRQKYGHYSYLLYPRSKYSQYGVARARVSDVSLRLFSNPPGNVLFEFKVEHDPFPENYCHSEVRTYKSGDRVMTESKVNKGVKLQYRELFAQHLLPIHRPGESF